MEPEQDERRRQIVEGLDAIGGWRDPAGVLEEVVFLVESPVVLEGRFDERFLELPPRVVETAMQSHQRYFPLEGARFAFVANGGDPEVVVAGNERVLEGRLEDAHFTFERDVAKGIEALAGELGSITFVAGRRELRRQGRAPPGARRASSAGARHRARPRASPRPIRPPSSCASSRTSRATSARSTPGSRASRRRCAPRSRSSTCPTRRTGRCRQTEPGRVLAAAEKIDNLTVAFALGQRPTGSRDPFGLRRAAIGLCRIAVEGGLAIDVAALVQSATSGLLVEQEAEVTDDPADVADFVFERLEGVLDVPVEFVRAARAGRRERAGRGRRRWRGRSRRKPRRRSSSARTSPSTAPTDSPGKADGAAATLDPSLATDEAERALIEALGRASPRIEAAVAERDFRGALAAAAELGPPVDRFFDEVLVMAEDERIRANRLRLLLDVRDAVGALGDLSQIPR